MINIILLSTSLAFLHSLSAALPVKREIATRQYTAPTRTNTDIDSTTTRIHVAPTVDYVVDGAVTYTTTLVPSDVDLTVQPSTSTIYGTIPQQASQPPLSVSMNPDHVSSSVQSSATLQVPFTVSQVPSTDLITSIQVYPISSSPSAVPSQVSSSPIQMYPPSSPSSAIPSQVSSTPIQVPPTDLISSIQVYPPSSSPAIPSQVSSSPIEVYPPSSSPSAIPSQVSSTPIQVPPTDLISSIQVYPPSSSPAIPSQVSSSPIEVYPPSSSPSAIPSQVSSSPIQVPPTDLISSIQVYPPSSSLSSAIPSQVSSSPIQVYPPSSSLSSAIPSQVSSPSQVPFTDLITSIQVGPSSSTTFSAPSHVSSIAVAPSQDPSTDLVSSTQMYSPSASSFASPPASSFASSSASSFASSFASPSSSSPSSPSSSPSSSSSSSNAASSGTNNNGGTNGLISVPKAVTYTPYNDDRSCKSSDEVNEDLQKIQSKGIYNIRVYGTDCGTFENLLPAASKLGIKVNQGLWIDESGVDSIDDAVQSLIEYGQQNTWDVFDFITVGNEAINSGFCTVSDLISKIQSVRSELNGAGYSGPVITSEPPVTFERNPTLCTDSGIDFVGANPHSYFDAGIDASQAGVFVKGQVGLTQTACGNMEVFVTETGFPSHGNINGQEVPSEENQRIALNSILEVMGNDVTILSFFNDKWKNPGPYGIEQWFGMENQLN